MRVQSVKWMNKQKTKQNKKRDGGGGGGGGDGGGERGGGEEGASYSNTMSVTLPACTLTDEAGWGDDTEINSSPGTNVNYA